MVAAVIMMLVSSRKMSGEPVIHGLHIIPALIILLREIIVSGLREFLAGSQVSVPVTALAKWKTTLQLVALGALILGGSVPGQPWVHDVGRDHGAGVADRAAGRDPVEAQHERVARLGALDVERAGLGVAAGRDLRVAGVLAHGVDSRRFDHIAIGNAQDWLV